jgi:hypothetical protein
MTCKHFIPRTEGKAETGYQRRITLGTCKYGLPYEDQTKCAEFPGRKEDGSECHGMTGKEWVEFDKAGRPRL